MSRVLTKDMYQRMIVLQTKNGINFNDIIQTGVDNPGHPFIMTVGCVAGDEESYEVFKEFFDQVIEKRHGGMYGSWSSFFLSINLFQSCINSLIDQVTEKRQTTGLLIS